jgi:hypothetical protein
MLPGLEGGQHDLFMQVRRRRDDDAIERAFAKHSPMVVERPGAAGARGGLSPGAFGIGHRFEFAARDMAQRSGSQPSNLSRTHQAEAHHDLNLSGSRRASASPV